MISLGFDGNMMGTRGYGWNWYTWAELQNRWVWEEVGMRMQGFVGVSRYIDKGYRDDVVRGTMRSFPLITSVPPFSS